MIEFIGHLDTQHPPEVVFELIADMAELHRWNPNVTASQRITGDRLCVGSTYLSTIQRGPLRMTARFTLTAVEPRQFVTYEGSISGFWSVDTLRFEGHGGRTRMTFENTTRIPRLIRWLGPLLDAAFQTQARRAVEGARRYLTESL